MANKKKVDNGIEITNKLYKNQVRIDSPKAVLRLLGRICNLVLIDDIEKEKAKCIGYLCNIMITGFKTVDLEERLEKLESLLEEQKGA